MGVCRFFQQGTCRFGTKCHNEHFDVKQYLKTDIESCINSNMWRFSVYGPFKDKPNVPNFIEDQSFEEVRFQAYESRRLNCFDQFHQQFTQQVHETVNKMKAMLQMTPQIIDMMVKIYDTPEGGIVNNNANPSANSFGSIFSQPAANGGNIFGAAAAAPVANSIFGGGAGGGAASGAGNIFGGSSNTNVFGQQQQQQQVQMPQGFGQQPQQQANPFGQQPQASIFAQPQQQAQQQQLNPFVQPQAAAAFPTNSIFATAQATNPTAAFGQSNPFHQQQQQQPVGIFAQAAAASNTGNIFTQQQQPQQQQPPPNGFFSQAAATGFQQPQQQLQADAQQQLQQQLLQQQQQQLQQQQQQQQQQQANNNNNVSSIYSRMEDLTQEEIAAFKAEQFAPGQVPLKPPPRELC